MGASKNNFSVVRIWKCNRDIARGSVVPLFNEIISNNAKFLPITDVNT